MTDAQALSAPLRVVAGFGLCGSAPTTEPLDVATWSALTAVVHHERIEGLLVAAVGAGALAVTGDQRRHVVELGRARAGVDLLLERELLGADEALRRGGVAFRLLKGPAWAHTAYPDPSWRGSGDVDLLVGPDAWYTAIALLEGVGARRALPELTPGFDRRFGKEATLDSAHGWEIDLHRTLVVGPFGLRVDPADLWAGRSTARVGDRDIPILGPECAFVHACYNAALGDDPPRLIAVRDVGQLARADGLDPDAVVDLTRRWRGEAVVIRALDLARGVLGIDVGATPVGAACARLRSSAGQRVLVASYRGPARGYTSQLAGVVALSGGRERLAYLDALARPQASYLAARSRTRLGHLGHGLARARSGRTGGRLGVGGRP